ncbi:hypothetical protein IDH44_09085 [Paenibacillus sp. IB182496]|uniref:Uncharacterized protein n=1 Tax=Paenibacillus sabuli TaxID=2772509 RepID=A0A927GRC9_9BACL|nr:hypothetical protein [Paenibacillus sabuli]MBD2845343.1 hypothetical protein [Paenibacillus sabuli]
MLRMPARCCKRAACHCLVQNVNLLARERRIDAKVAHPAWMGDEAVRKQLGIGEQEQAVAVLEFGLPI